MRKPMTKRLSLCVSHMVPHWLLLPIVHDQLQVRGVPEDNQDWMLALAPTLMAPNSDFCYSIAI